MTDYKSLAEGDYGTSKVPGLEIIKYTGAKDQNNGTVRHSFLVKAIQPSRQQVEAARGASDMYAAEPDIEGTTFLSIALKPEWLAPALVAVAMGNGREKLALAKGVTQAQLDAANAHIVEQATELATTFGEVTEEAVTEHETKLKQQIQINVGTIYRLQDWAQKPQDATVDFNTLAGVKFSGSVEGRDYNGKRFVDVKVRPPKK